MSPRDVTNVAASVHDRLLGRVRSTGEDANDTMLRFVLERFLYRLGASRHASSFMLKGATLFAVWESEPHRATRDIDLLGFGEDSADRLKAVFADVSSVVVPEDGTVFDPNSLTVGDIRKGAAYRGKRIRMGASLGTARFTVQVDIGFGDDLAVWDTMVTLPTLLDFPAPRLRAYPAEAVIAEKLHAMVQHGMLTSRMKDIYDVRALAARMEFSGADLTRAVQLTFARRGRPISDALPAPLTKAFAADPVMLQRWAGFLRRNRLKLVPLAGVSEDLRRFVLEPWQALAHGEEFAKRWPAGGPWK